MSNDQFLNRTLSETLEAAGEPIPPHGETSSAIPQARVDPAVDINAALASRRGRHAISNNEMDTLYLRAKAATDMYNNLVQQRQLLDDQIADVTITLKSIDRSYKEIEGQV